MPDTSNAAHQTILEFFHQQVKNVEGLAGTVGSTLKGDAALAATAISTALGAAEKQLAGVLAGQALTAEQQIQAAITATLAKYTPLIAAEVKALLEAAGTAAVKDLA